MTDTAKFHLPFEKKIQLTDDTWTFYFRRNGTEKEHKPGQYFEIKLDIKNSDDRGNTRVFTISSSPTNKEFFAITTRIIQSSFKKALFNLRPNTMIPFEGPWDDIEVDLNDHSSKVFLAGGIGITPFHSIVEYCFDTDLDLPIILFSSWSSENQVVFHNFFRKCEKKLSSFKYLPTITQNKIQTSWDGEMGRIDQSVIERHVVNPNSHTYYIVGPGGFIKGMELVLTNMKIPQEKIVFEHFSGY